MSGGARKHTSKLRVESARNWHWLRRDRTDPAGGTIVADLGANGRDFWSAYARDIDDGSVDVFYDRYLCGKTSSDIYRIHDPHPGP